MRYLEERRRMKEIPSCELERIPRTRKKSLLFQALLIGCQAISPIVASSVGHAHQAAFLNSVGRGSTRRLSRMRPASSRSMDLHVVHYTQTKRNQSSSSQGERFMPPKVARKNKNRSKLEQSVTNNAHQTWRVFGVNVHPDLLAEYESSSRTTIQDTPVDKLYLYPPVVDALRSRLKLRTSSAVDDDEDLSTVTVVRRSLDARKKLRANEKDPGPRYSYVLDVDMSGTMVKKLRLRHQPGRLELLPETTEAPQVKADSLADCKDRTTSKARVIIVGAGPAGLFCALTLARSGTVTPILLERGQPVESRGKDIGALMHRRSLDSESNFAFGEGGAGTWSDGKLTTRIGRNSQDVRFVLETLVEYGAPKSILVDGAPHLGTDNLVRLLRNMRNDLRQSGGEIRFGSKVTGLVMENGSVNGVRVEFGEAVERGPGGVPVVQQSNLQQETILGDAVVLATGHSARDIYEELNEAGVKLEAKGFAAGFRVEHPQKIINEIQYGDEWAPSVVTGKSITDNANAEYIECRTIAGKHHPGKLPVPSYRLATDKAFDGSHHRGAYSFCMCPGGQIVPASTDPEEVCVNGMSFSKRDSLWANSALVVTIAPDDEILDPYRAKHGVLSGVAFQKEMEQRASKMGGGNLTVPVQRLTDFVAGQASSSAPPSSYRLGVKPAACHEIYPPAVTNALRDAVLNHFEQRMPGFMCEDALLHAVETRTSSPVRVARDPDTMQAIGTYGLFPAGEGAGYAGGIVSAAVDGMLVGEAVLASVVCRGGGKDKLDSSRRRRLKGRPKSIGFSY